MASLQPTVGGIPQPSATKTFADAVLSQPTSHTLLQPDPTPAHPSAQGLPGLHKGLPSISFSDAATSDLSRPFSWTLIGKFSQGYNKKDPKLGRPSVADLQKYFLAMDFHGSFQLGLLDNRHLLIQFNTQEDYLRVFSRQIWYVRAVTMRIFKWSPYFRVDKESSIVPLWISFPRLPVHLFQRDALFSIARLIGEPLRVDDATSKLKRPSVARLQVELDVLRDRPPKVWIQMGSKEGFWQAVDYENVPPYCCHCWHIGHHEQDCRVLHPALQSTQVPQQKQVYVAKQSAHHADNHASGSGLVAEQMVTRPVSASVGNEVQARNSTVDIGVHEPEPKGPTSEDHVELDFVEPAAGISAGEPSLAALTTIRPDAASLSGVAIALPVAPEEPEPTGSVATYKNVLVDNNLQGMVAQEIGFPPTAIESVPTAIEPLCIEGTPSSVTYAKILQGSPEKDISLEARQPLVLSTPSTSQNTPVPELIAQPVTPMLENIDGMSSDDDVSQYPFLLPELITDDTVLYRRKLQEVVAQAWSDTTKVLLEKPRAELLAEFGEFHARMRSKAVKDFAQNPVSQDTLPLDDTLTDINVEDGDFADGFITVKPKNRGRGRPRKHKK